MSYVITILLLVIMENMDCPVRKGQGELGGRRGPSGLLAVRVEEAGSFREVASVPLVVAGGRFLRETLAVSTVEWLKVTSQSASYRKCELSKRVKVKYYVRYNNFR